MTETYLPIYCPVPQPQGGICHGFLGKVAKTHHSLFSNTCPKCGALFRIFYNADGIIELTLAPFLRDDVEEPVLEVSWGKRRPDKDAPIEVVEDEEPVEVPQ